MMYICLIFDRLLINFCLLSCNVARLSLFICDWSSWAERLPSLFIGLRLKFGRIMVDDGLNSFGAWLTRCLKTLNILSFSWFVIGNSVNVSCAYNFFSTFIKVNFSWAGLSLVPMFDEIVRNRRVIDWFVFNFILNCWIHRLVVKN